MGFQKYQKRGGKMQEKEWQFYVDQYKKVKKLSLIFALVYGLLVGVAVALTRFSDTFAENRTGLGATLVALCLCIPFMLLMAIAFVGNDKDAARVKKMVSMGKLKLVYFLIATIIAVVVIIVGFLPGLGWVGWLGALLVLVFTAAVYVGLGASAAGAASFGAQLVAETASAVADEFGSGGAFSSSGGTTSTGSSGGYVPLEKIKFEKIHGSDKYKVICTQTGNWIDTVNDHNINVNDRSFVANSGKTYKFNEGDTFEVKKQQRDMLRSMKE